MRAMQSKVPRRRTLPVSRFDLGGLLVVGLLGLMVAFIMMMVVAGVTGTWNPNQ